ncbi:hypothetical protein PoB_006977900 [Plakobranchus ocellatus]|uniref:Uncharacterized protein n=1 Tax=Plakobranchus ocellatus TaxID=259542 RepID=A0AAV4DGW9_9GAST|nr:hypothetical protein PoB_006977900 [Plakobranchus ocellatus]
MKLILATVVAAFVAVALGDELCFPKSFKSQSFDAVEFNPITHIYHAERQASLYKSLKSRSEFRVLDFQTGRVYVQYDDGSCGYYVNDFISVLNGTQTDVSGIMPNLEIDDYIPGPDSAYGFNLPIGDVTFQFLQDNANGKCNLMYFALILDGVPRLVFFHGPPEEASLDDLHRVEDALEMFETTGCPEISY